MDAPALPGLEPPHPADAPAAPAGPMKPTRKTRKPYIWVTWITGLIAGDDDCGWAAWFRVHFNFQEREKKELDDWKRNHTEMVKRRAAELEREGYTVYLEGQNSFKLEGRTAIVSGKPDIVAVKRYALVRPATADEAPTTLEGYWVIVEDCKTGKRRKKDKAQVLVYLYAYTIAPHPGFPKDPGRVTIVGQVTYLEGFPVRIEPEEMNANFKTTLLRVIAESASEHESKRVPSYGECLFCNISKHDCPDRVDTEPGTPTEDF